MIPLSPSGNQVAKASSSRSSAYLKRSAVLIALLALITSGILLGFGFTLASRVNGIENDWQQHRQQENALSLALARLKTHFGDNGFNHHIKRYVLQKDTRLIPIIDADFQHARKALALYPRENLAGHALSALERLELVLDTYQKRFALAQQLISQGAPPNLIDSQTRVNDRPVAEALRLLTDLAQQQSDKQRNAVIQTLTAAQGFLHWGALLLLVMILMGVVLFYLIKKQAKVHLQAKNTRHYLGDLFNAAPDAMLIVNDHGYISDANQQAVEMFGYQRTELQGMSVENLMPPRYRSQHVSLRDASFENPRHRVMNAKTVLEALTKDGQEIPVEIGLNYTRDNDKSYAITTLRDITERIKIDWVLRRNEKMLNKAQQIANVGSWDWSLDSNNLLWSEQMHRILGAPSDTAEGRYENFIDCIHPQDRNVVEKALAAAVACKHSLDLEHRIVQPGGMERIVQLRGEVFCNDKAVAVQMVGTLHDITERRRVENQLRIADNVFEHTSEAIMVTDADKTILRVNKAFTNITGYSETEAVGSSPNKLLKSGKHDDNFYQSLWHTLMADGVWEGEILDRHKNGVIFPCWHNISNVTDGQGNVIQHISIFSDITEKKVAEEHIQNLAQFDQLTKLPNRMLFYDRLQQAFSRARRNKSKIGLMFIDLDRFKIVNDSLGHHAGDQLLIEVAKRLTKSVRGQDTVARFAGDEFTIVLEDLKDGENAGRVAENVLKALAVKVVLDNNEIVTGASIGISIYPDDGEEVESLVKNADMAMYLAKGRGKNRYEFYTRELANIEDERYHVENRLRQALHNKEFEVYYQPQVNWEQGIFVGAEALIRWRHPDKGIIEPAEFIRMAEEIGLIEPIGRWVLMQACLCAKAWQDKGLPLSRVSVNVSGYQITSGSIVDAVQHALEETGLSPGCLELEIAENFVMQHASSGLAALAAIRALGVSLAIGDFGTGYSSLSCLKQLSIDRLKIDRSMIVGDSDSNDDMMVVPAIIAMAKNLDLAVIAVGVENEAQVAFLRKHGCMEMQGYYFCPPMEEQALLAFIQQPVQGCTNQLYVKAGTEFKSA